MYRPLLAAVLAVGAAALASAAAQPAARVGAAYYVDSRSGNDAHSGRSPGQAWRTLARAAGLRPHGGARLLLRRGSSWREELDLASSGSRSQPFVVAPYGAGAPPLIHGDRTCVRVTGSFVRVSGLAVRDCAWAGIALVGSFIRVDHTRISGAAAGIDVTPGSRSDQILRNVLIRNNRMSVLTRTPRNDDSGAFGILLGGRATLVARNRIEGSDAFSYDYGRDGSAVEVYGGRDDTIVRNVALDDHAFTELGGPRSADNTFAYNLFVSTTVDATFLVTRGPDDPFGPVRNTRVYNTTAVVTGRGAKGVVCDGGCGPGILRLRNNVVVAAGDALEADAPFDEADDVFSGSIAGVPLGPRSVVSDPRFEDPRSGDYRLRPSSPAIDRGVPLGYDRDLVGAPVRALPDAGCFEDRRSG